MYSATSKCDLERELVLSALQIAKTLYYLVNEIKDSREC